jgi:hypothetical protein
MLACRLPDEQILDRVEVLNTLEPDQAKQPALYADRWHFKSAVVYHDFNWQLLTALSPSDVSNPANILSSGCMQSMHSRSDYSVGVAVLAASLLAFSAALFS